MIMLLLCTVVTMFMLYVIVINWVPRNYGSKRTDPEGVARGRGLFTLP